MKKLIFTAVALLLAGVARANVVTNTTSTALLDGATSTISLAKFDSSLGTLTGVYVKYWTTLSNVEVQLDNDGVAGSGTGKALITATGFVSEPRTVSATFNAGDLSVSQQQTYSLEATSGDPTDAFNATGLGDYADWTPGDVSGVASGDILLYLEDYIGSGTYTVSVNTSFLVGGTFSGTGYVLANTDGGTFNGEVIYTYSPIPEPATAPLLALVVGAGFWIRRRFLS